MLPLLAQIVTVPVRGAGRERQGGVSDDEHGFVRKCGERVEILRLRPRFRELRMDLPHLAAEQLQQRHGRAGRSGYQNGLAVEFRSLMPAEKRDAADRAIAGNREFWQQDEVLRVPQILNGTDHARDSSPAASKSFSSTGVPVTN